VLYISLRSSSTIVRLRNLRDLSANQEAMCGVMYEKSRSHFVPPPLRSISWNTKASFGYCPLFSSSPDSLKRRHNDHDKASTIRTSVNSISETVKVRFTEERIWRPIQRRSFFSATFWLEWRSCLHYVNSWIILAPADPHALRHHKVGEFSLTTTALIFAVYPNSTLNLKCWWYLQRDAVQDSGV